MRDRDLYFKWLQLWYKVANPVYFYSDNKTIVEMFLKIRSKTSFTTHAIYLPRLTMWSFNLVPEIWKIFNQTSYPKIPPNTMVPEYVVSQHAKVEVINRTITKFKFSNDHPLIWLDIGVLREYKHNHSCGKFVLPPSFDEQKIGASLVTGTSLIKNRRQKRCKSST